jgi:hypothetical protein
MVDSDKGVERRRIMLSYPENKPSGEGISWHKVSLKDGTIDNACWWGSWYCYSRANEIIMFDPTSNTTSNTTEQ